MVCSQVVGVSDQIASRVGLLGRPGEISPVDRGLVGRPFAVDILGRSRRVDRVEKLGLEPGAGSVVPPPVVAGLGVGACVELSKNEVQREAGHFNQTK